MLDKRHITALITHLQELKRSGVTHVNYSDSSIDALHAALVSSQESSIPPLEASLANPPTVMLPPHPDKTFLFTVLQAQLQTNPVITSHLNPNCSYVLGRGNLNAPICIIGEAPGAEEEKQGLPFVGAAGQLLTKVLTDLSLLDFVFITNIMVWRPQMDTPSGNRPPTQQEMEFSLPFCKAQLDIVKPSCILALGATAVNGLIGFDKTRRITKIRGTQLSYNNIPVIPTYHPSYLLRMGSKDLRQQFISDFILAKQLTRLPIHSHETDLIS